MLIAISFLNVVKVDNLRTYFTSVNCVWILDERGIRSLMDFGDIGFVKWILSFGLISQILN